MDTGIYSVYFTPGKGRKRNRNEKQWKRSNFQENRHKPRCLPTLPNCVHKKKTFCCNELSVQGVRRFYEAFYASYSKNVQDQFILNKLLKEGVYRKTKDRANVLQFPSLYIHTKNKRITSILDVSTFHVQHICQVFLNTSWKLHGICLN